MSYYVVVNTEPMDFYMRCYIHERIFILAPGSDEIFKWNTLIHYFVSNCDYPLCIENMSMCI